MAITAGQLGIGLEGSIRPGREGQAAICFANIAAILAEDGMKMADSVHLNVFVTAREPMDGCRACDRQFPGTPPTTTRIVVADLVRSQFVLEIETLAAAAAPQGRFRRWLLSFSLRCSSVTHRVLSVRRGS
jgi:enamine deaminase RidA (YjgF/YER057c/UK114 family)